jgi:hypothetical protein
MTIELICVTLIFSGGLTFIYSMGIRGYSVLPLGIVLGITIQIIIGSIQIMTGLPNTPLLTVALVFTLPLVWLCCNKNPHRLSKDNFSGLCLYLSMIFAVVTLSVIYLFHRGWVNSTNDSLRYMLTCKIFYENRLDVLSEDLLTKRMFGVPVVHMPAQVANNHYLRTIFPLLGLSTVAALMWFTKKSLEDTLTYRKAWILTAIGGMLLISNNRFIWNLFYINGHLVCAALTLFISACGWLMVYGKIKGTVNLFPLMVAAIPALIFTRPESVIIATIAVIPIIASDVLSWKYKSTLLLTLGVSTTAFYGYATWFLDGGFGSFYGIYLIYGIAVVCVALLLKHMCAVRIIKLLVRKAVAVAEIFLWVVLLMLFLLDSQVLMESLNATYINLVLGEGLWGLSIVILCIITALVLVFIKRPMEMAVLRLPVTTFLPIMFTLVYLREGVYRVGSGDSLNRILIQIVPLAILFIILSVGLGRFRFAKNANN